MAYEDSQESGSFICDDYSELRGLRQLNNAKIFLQKYESDDKMTNVMTRFADSSVF
ncbi:MAG: hypothetical protein OHK0010_29510 [Anaerolineales bacterium]